MGTAALEMLAAESLAPPAPGEDRRITRSKRALRGALIALIEERGLDAITVNDLCERADLNRGTFYNHFHDKENLLTALENEVLAEVALLQARMQSVTLGDMLAFRVAGRPVPVLVDLFEYLRGESDFLRAVLGSGGDVRFGPRLREAVCENLVQNILHEKYRTNPTPFVCYYVAFYASAYLGIIARWVENGCPETPEEMARIAMRLLFITPGEPIEL
ncbi:TetR/AcrR family transcriptional regulator [uncultured Adlercreutzia sp.]|uniref:TetR/AcrR family transcriptional regulator n=1 Tax=uncultured Adlercreutzia sp. TaxID=875803 RepID=UPI00339CA9EA